jgi:hypothetical protein
MSQNEFTNLKTWIRLQNDKIFSFKKVQILLTRNVKTSAYAVNEDRISIKNCVHCFALMYCFKMHLMCLKI